MSVVINTNYSATVASNNLSASNAQLQTSLNRLSSGSKIVNPSDDAGGLAVAMKLSAAAKRSGAASNNISNSVSFLQAQDGVLKVAGKVLERISELSTLYTDPTKNSTDLANYNAEFTQLQSELSSLTNEKFNGVSLFSSSGITTGTSEDGSQTVTISAKDLASTASVGSITSTGVSSLASSSLALSTITTSIGNVATMRANNGAEQVGVLETNLDDTSGELVGYCISRLWDAGALDVYATAIQMKKNRPAVKLTVLCRPEDAAATASRRAAVPSILPSLTNRMLTDGS